MLTIIRSSITTFLARSRFRQEIVLVFIAKVLGLWLLWSLFFSHPTDHQLKKPELVTHYLVDKVIKQ